MQRCFSVVVLAALAAGTACQKKSDGTGAAAPGAQQAAQQPAPAQADAILIGNVMPLSGDTATFGEGANDGVKLAVDEANAAGGVKGRKLALQACDTQGKPEETAVAATRLITETKASLLIGELGSSRTLALAPIADSYKVPAITPVSTNARVTKDGDATRPYMLEP